MSVTEAIWRPALLSLNATLAQAIETLNEVGIKVVLCAERDGRLVGTVTDGDLRRGLLRGLSMEDRISEIVNRSPLVVPEGADREMAKALMKANKVQQVPIVDTNGHVIGVHVWDSIDVATNRDNIMVIMAGGKGTRLRPHTEHCPKPMLSIAGKPILQHIVERAKSQGFSRFIFALNYLGDIIRGHFEDGAKLGICIEYISEDSPLGTAGALSLLKPRPEAPFVVTNGDVLTDIDYGALLDFRSRQDAAAVMAVRLHEWSNPFGVVQMNGVEITGFTEKPVIRSHINAGVYALEPEALRQLEPNAHCDMPTLFDRLRRSGLRTVAFPMHEPWLDIGRPSDLERALEIMSHSIEKA